MRLHLLVGQFVQRVVVVAQEYPMSYWEVHWPAAAESASVSPWGLASVQLVALTLVRKMLAKVGCDPRDWPMG